MLKDQLKAAGVRLTPQRLAIVDVLEGNTEHPSAEALFRAVKKRYPTMSFATVYNTLEALKKADCVRELKIDSTRRRFDPNTVPHHHLFCCSCGKIVDIHVEYRLDLPRAISAAFEVAGNHVEFFGNCRRCSDQGVRAARQPGSGHAVIEHN